jgi:hypothetical protein
MAPALSSRAKSNFPSLRSKHRYIIVSRKSPGNYEFISAWAIPTKRTLTAIASLPNDKNSSFLCALAGSRNFSAFGYRDVGEMTKAWNTCCASVLARRQWTANLRRLMNNEN